MTSSINVYDDSPLMLRDGRMSNVLRVLPGWTLVLTTPFIGFLLGAPGGLLLGTAEIVLINHWKSINLLENLSQISDIYIVLPAMCIGIDMISLTVGILSGIVVFSHIIKVEGEEAAGKAMALAGPVCLIVVCVVGAVFGIALFIDAWFWGRLYGLVVLLSNICGWVFSLRCLNSFDLPLLGFLSLVITWTVNMHVILHFYSLTVPVSFRDQRLLLIPLSIYPIFFCSQCYLSRCPKNPIFVTVIILPFITVAQVGMAGIGFLVHIDSVQMDLFMFLFYIILTPQAFMICAGMSVFDYWKRGAEVKICLTSVLCGGVALVAVKLALPVLGPGPPVGAVMGVMGAVGVSLGAAGAVTQKWAGRLGVILGTVVGAFISSCVLRVELGVISAACMLVSFLMQGSVCFGHIYINKF